MALHAGGPVRSGRWVGLRWVDMLAGDVLSLAADWGSGRQVGVAACVRPRRSPGRGLSGARPASAAMGATCPGQCRTIASSPLTVKASADTALQVAGDTAGQVYPPNNDPGTQAR